jgi:uncharacterized protein YaiE (UPF0345 family)
MSIESSDDDSATAGFVKRHVYTFSIEQMETGRVELLVPNTNEYKTYASNSYMKASTAEAAAIAARIELKESILKSAGADEEPDVDGDKVPKKSAQSFMAKSDVSDLIGMLRRSARHCRTKMTVTPYT